MSSNPVKPQVLLDGCTYDVAHEVYPKVVYIGWAHDRYEATFAEHRPGRRVVVLDPADPEDAMARPQTETR